MVHVPPARCVPMNVPKVNDRLAVVVVRWPIVKQDVAVMVFASWMIAAPHPAIAMVRRTRRLAVRVLKVGNVRVNGVKMQNVPIIREPSTCICAHNLFGASECPDGLFFCVARKCMKATWGSHKRVCRSGTKKKKKKKT